MQTLYNPAYEVLTHPDLGPMIYACQKGMRGDKASVWYWLKHGQQEMLAWYACCHPRAYWMARHATCAALYGHLHLVEWLEQNFHVLPEPWCAKYVAYNGHLDVLQWMYQHQQFVQECIVCNSVPSPENLQQYPYPGIRSMSLANMALHGRQFHVAQWLQEVGWVPDLDAMAMAAAVGHIDVMEWLTARNLVSDVALEPGSDVTKWLSARGMVPSMGWSPDHYGSMWLMVRGMFPRKLRGVGIIDWLTTHGLIPDVKPWQMAIQYAQIRVLKWLECHTRGSVADILTQIFGDCTTIGMSSIMKLCETYRVYAFTQNHIDTSLFLREYGYTVEVDSEFVSNVLLHCDDVCTLRLLKENGCVFGPCECAVIIQRNRLDMWEWLVQNVSHEHLYIPGGIDQTPLPEIADWIIQQQSIISPGHISLPTLCTSRKIWEYAILQNQFLSEVRDVDFLYFPDGPDQKNARKDWMDLYDTAEYFRSRTNEPWHHKLDVIHRWLAQGLDDVLEWGYGHTWMQKYIVYAVDHHDGIHHRSLAWLWTLPWFRERLAVCERTWLSRVVYSAFSTGDVGALTWLVDHNMTWWETLSGPFWFYTRHTSILDWLRRHNVLGSRHIWVNLGQDLLPLRWMMHNNPEWADACFCAGVSPVGMHKDPLFLARLAEELPFKAATCKGCQYWSTYLATFSGRLDLLVATPSLPDDMGPLLLAKHYGYWHIVEWYASRGISTSKCIGGHGDQDMEAEALDWLANQGSDNETKYHDRWYEPDYETFMWNGDWPFDVVHQTAITSLDETCKVDICKFV